MTDSILVALSLGVMALIVPLMYELARIISNIMLGRNY